MQEVVSCTIKAYVWHCNSTALSFKKTKEKRVESEFLPIFAWFSSPLFHHKNYSTT